MKNQAELYQKATIKLIAGIIVTAFLSVVTFLARGWLVDMGFKQGAVLLTAVLWGVVAIVLLAGLLWHHKLNN